MEEADAAVSGGGIEKGTVIVIRYEGPKGGPGMREMLSTTALSWAGAWMRTAPWSRTDGSQAQPMGPAWAMYRLRQHPADPSVWWRTGISY